MTLRNRVFYKSKRPKLKPIPVTDFNGISLVKTEDTEYRYAGSEITKLTHILARNVVSNPAKQDLRGRRKNYTIDSIQFNSKGDCKFAGSVKMITDSAFYQLLSFLAIPRRFAQRMPSDLMITVINRMLTEDYSRGVTVFQRVLDGRLVIAGIAATKRCGYQSNFDILTSLLQTYNGKIMVGTLKNQTINIFVVFDDKSIDAGDIKISPGFELSYSQAGEIAPTITPFIASDGYNLLDAENAVTIDMDSVGRNGIMYKVPVIVDSILYDSAEMMEKVKRSYSEPLNTDGRMMLTVRSARIIGDFPDIDRNKSAAENLNKMVMKAENECNNIDSMRKAIKLAGNIVRSTF